MTRIQLAANRRNARKSTGPKSVAAPAAGQKLPSPADGGDFRQSLNHENYQTNPNAKFDFTQQIRPDTPCLDTGRMEKRTQMVWSSAFRRPQLNISRATRHLSQVGSVVAQVSNLPYRRLLVGSPPAQPKSFGIGEPCPLETRESRLAAVAPKRRYGAPRRRKVCATAHAD